jgi:predicted 2-oxoglutarate/Fe(II)-dependent dioxygenase YbiX
MPVLADGVFTIPEFLTPDECAQHIASAEAHGFEAATIETLGRSIRDPLIRNNDRIIKDDQALAGALWGRLAPHVPPFMDGRPAWGLNERWRIYRYQPGQRFAGHVDGSFRRESGERSLLTLLLYLNDQFEGGETTFDDLVVTPVRGLALVFRHDLFHAGEPLGQGTKYVLRSDVMFGPVGTIRG